MDQLKFVLEALVLDDTFTGSPAGDEIQSELQKALLLGRPRCIQCLVQRVREAANCTIPSCRSCRQIKAVIAHAKVCLKKTYFGCPICHPLISLFFSRQELRRNRMHVSSL